MELKNMRFTKKRELLLDESETVRILIGYSLCTVYSQSLKTDRIELWSLGYCPSDKEFYYTKRIHLPKEIVNYFNGAEYSPQNIAKMEELGIYNGDDMQRLINLYKKAKKEYTESKIQMEIEKQKVLDFRRTLRKDKHNN